MLNTEATKIWQTYLTVINEAKEITYIDPPPRAKFQNGDAVVIRDDGRFSSYQNKKQLQYVNKSGVVVGYKNIPGAYSKFAIQFADGVIHLIHGHFLYGPFTDLATARKYEDTSVEFDSGDIKGSKTDWETKPTFELKMKELLTQAPFNFTWFDTPQINKKSKGKTFLFTLAARGPFELLRANTAMTKKLTTADYNTGGFTKGYALRLPADYIKGVSDWFGSENILVVPPTDSNEYSTYYRSNVNDLIQDKPHYVKLFDIYETFQRVGKIDDEVFLKIADVNITGNPLGGYTYTVPPALNNYSHTALVYNPVTCRDVTIFDQLTIKGDAVVKGRSYNDVIDNLVRSPKAIHGNLTIQPDCRDYTGGSFVTGSVRCSDDPSGEKYQDFIRRQGLKDTVSSIFSDDENIIDW